ncbi:uncharacterized protein LOC135200292 isoform X1 [Macrobrachium nipponense]|uniref:uncharacterized protein LOC135200292 isoform X1 n=1 Tax=Macrobrachium nipponense TaxID=159736 RepID=UPI0030C8366D
MGDRWILLLALAFITGHVRSQSQLEFNITTTWNGGDIKHDPIQLVLTGSPDGEYLDLAIEAPFFNDPPAPPGPAGQPFYGLWNYEVVEAFFLNDNNQYLEVEVCPWGQHIVLLLNGQRAAIRHSLPLEVNTTRTGNKWIGNARIPVGYLPKNVTKFNAYGIHGSDENRVYESLYPAPGNATAPDFHALEYFNEIDLSEVLPDQASAEMSELWSDSIEGVFRYRIQTAWNGAPIDHAPVEITLQGFTAGVEMNVTAPFFNDPRPPNGREGMPYYGLWEYEVVEMFFLNDKDEYLEVELGPWGEHLLLMLKGARNAIKHSLALDYFAVRDEATGTWKGSAMIPPDYFPPKVSRVNAYAIHGVDDQREYQSLYPAPFDDPDYPAPDFHRLELFRPIDFEYQLANNSEYSDLWKGTINTGSGSGSSSFTPMNEEDNNEDFIGAVTVLGPGAEAFKPTSAPEQLLQSQSHPGAPLPVLNPQGADRVVFQPTPTPIQQSHSRTEGDLPTKHEEVPSRIPKPQLIVPDETRKQREGEAPNFFSPPSLSGHEPRVPHPIRLGNSRRTPTAERQNVERQPSRTSSSQSHDQFQGEPIAPEIPQIRGQRPFIQNQNERPSSFSIRRRPPQFIDGNLPSEQEQFSNIHSPFQSQDQTSASSQFQAHGQVFGTSPVVGERRPAFTVQQEPGSQFVGQPFINQDTRQPPRPTLFQDGSLFHDQRQPNLPNQGRPPFLSPEFPFQDPGQTQFFSDGQPLPNIPGRPQFENRDQQQFLNHGQPHFQDPVETHFQDPAQPQFPNNVGTRFSNQGHSQIQVNERLPIQSESHSPSSAVFESQGAFEHNGQGQSPVQFTETAHPDEFNPTESPNFQTEDQNIQGHQTFDVPGSVSSVAQPHRPVGLEEALTPEVQEALDTLSEGSPALPPPHPVCFERGLVPDPERCYVFHECVLEAGQWEMYSWRCKRGQIFDPVSVACVRGRCARRGQLRRRVRGQLH